MNALVSTASRVTTYARDVLAGRIVAGPYVRLACERHLRDVKAWGRRRQKGVPFWFDRAAATRAIDFFEQELVLPDMLDDATGECLPFVLSPWQAFIVGSLFGWKKANGHRRFRTAYIETGKGSGKSPLAAGVALYCLVADDLAPRYPEVYSAAVSQKQAGIPWTDADRMVQHAPRLGEHVEQKAHVLVGRSTGGKFEAVSREAKSLEGKRPHCAVIEEVHEHPNDQVVSKMRRGTKGNKDAIIFEITNAGVEKKSICWRHHEMSVKYLEQALPNETWFAYICALDEGDDFRDPAVWPKANPNIGVTIDGAYLQEAITECDGDPAAEADVRRLNFCEWLDKQSSFLRSDRWLACTAETRPDLSGIAPYGGLDLGLSNDFSAFALVWPLGDDRYYTEVRHWVAHAVTRKNKSLPWLLWQQRARLTITDGNVTDFLRVRADVSEVARAAGCRVIAYDHWSAQQMSQELQGEGFKMINNPQGFRLNEPTLKLSALVAAGTLLHDGDGVLTWEASNVTVKRGTRGDIRPVKPEDDSPDKVDGIVALIMALDRALLEAPKRRSRYSNPNARVEAVAWP